METATKDIVNFPIEDTADQLRMESYHSIFKEAGHLWLAMHAAFPIALTTDLLYKIWMNFIPNNEDIPTNETYGRLSSKVLERAETPKDNPIPINAVGDILLSPFCRAIGHDLYEFYPNLRDALWKTLPLKRQLQLADFLLCYLEFCPDKVPSKAFAESQRIWAEITLGQFDRVNSRLAELYASNTLQNATSKRDFILNLIAKKTDSSISTNETSGNTSLSDVEKLTQGINAYKQGNQEVARDYLESIRQNLSSEKTIKGFNVPIPKSLWESLPVPGTETEPPKGKIYALLVGIDEYGDKEHFINLKNNVSNLHHWEELLRKQATSITLEIILLINQQATKQNIINSLVQISSRATEKDTILIYFSGHILKSGQDNFGNYVVAYDTRYNEIGSYIYSGQFRHVINQNNRNSFLTIILDAFIGSPQWIDIKNEKEIVIFIETASQSELETNNQGVLTAATKKVINEKIDSHSFTYRKLIRYLFPEVKKITKIQTPQLFGHPKAINQAFLGGSASQATYISELLQDCGYQDIHKVISDFEIENQEESLIATLEKYALLKGAEKLKIVRISSEMSVRQIPVFQREYLKSLPYEVEIKDLNLFHRPDQSGMKDAVVAPADELEDDLSALQDAQVIVFILNRALVRNFVRHTAIAPIINHLRRFEYKVVCSILWEDCDRGDTALRDYPVFSLRQPLSQALFQKYNFAPEVEREIEEYYQDWQPVINKWISDLAALGFEKELKERIEKAKQTQELDLSGMGFETLPEAVWELEDLKTIDLYNNKLTELPEYLTQFQSLEKLYASKNPISVLPLFLSDLPNLRVLKIDDAQITEFPNWLCKHPALEDISLENNQIEIIPSALKDLPKLRLMDFRGNPVINLPVSFLKATKGSLKEYIQKVLLTSFTQTNNITYNSMLVLETDRLEEMNTITQIFDATIDISSTAKNNYEAIYYLPSVDHRPLIVHLPQSIYVENEVQKLSKLFLEYLTGTIFFLNFSNSKRLADLLYQQKHVPIIAFEGELDEETAGNAVRYFYSHYQESKNAMTAFDHMVSQLVEIPSSSKGKYILYRY